MTKTRENAKNSPNMIAYSFFMTEKMARLLILKLRFLCFSGVATASNLSFQAPAIVCHHVGTPASLVIFSPLFLYLGGRTLLALQSLLLGFQEHISHEYEENEASHSYCTLIVRKNLTAVLTGRDSEELQNFRGRFRQLLWRTAKHFSQGCHGKWKIFFRH